jgi:hypothetical protein
MPAARRGHWSFHAAPGNRAKFPGLVPGPWPSGRSPGRGGSGATSRGRCTEFRPQSNFNPVYRTKQVNDRWRSRRTVAGRRENGVTALARSSEAAEPRQGPARPSRQYRRINSPHKVTQCAVRKRREPRGCMSSLLNDPAHWRLRAQEAQLLASQLDDPVAKAATLKIAREYERLAARAASREMVKK